MAAEEVSLSGVYAPPPPRTLVVLSDREGFLGVFDSGESAAAAIEGYENPVVAQAWAGMEGRKEAWVIPSLGVGLPPLFVTDDRDEALVVHHAFAEIGAAPAADDINVWRLKVGELSAPARRRLKEHQQKWDDERRAWAQRRFESLTALGRKTARGGSPAPIAGSVAELVVRRDRTADAAAEPEGSCPSNAAVPPARAPRASHTAAAGGAGGGAGETRADRAIGEPDGKV